ncbi:MAG TPA: GntP family permease [Bacillales bacterium]|nr:GntP family permease [Bacillales bacterium]
MDPSVASAGPYILILLLVSIIVIVLLTTKLKLHPFLSIIIAAYLFGLGANLIGQVMFGKSLIESISKTMASGFGGILGEIGLVIIFGTIIGKILEKTGAAVTMAETVLKWIGDRHPALGMSVIGWVVSIPVFCDSGYVVLSSLNKSVAKKANVNVVVTSVALATGLYASHTFVPPTPGPIAAAGNLGIGANGLIWVILFGAFVSLFTMFAGYIWATRFSKDLPSDLPGLKETFEEYKASFGRIPTAFQAFAPILIPIILMALGSIANFPVGTLPDGSKETFMSGSVYTVVNFIGKPVTALFIGVIFAFLLLAKNRGEEALTNWVGDGMKDAAIIIMITGAGGAFGTMIAATPIADYIKTLLGGDSIFVGAGALFILFFIAALLKTAQGSSTTALVVTSTIAMPLMSILGLDVMMGNIPIGQVLAVMAIGSGAMVVSHVNDSYFWVVSQFSGMSVTTAYRAQTMATLVQGITGIVVTFLLGLLLL